MSNPLRTFLDHLNAKGVKWSGGSNGGVRFACTGHDGTKDSAIASVGDDGRLLLHCHSHPCTAEDICRGAGMEPRLMFPDSERKHKREPVRKTVINGQSVSVHATREEAALAAAYSVQKMAEKAGWPFEKRKPDVEYDYHDAEGRVSFVVCRWNTPGRSDGGTKEIRPIRPHDGGWIAKGLDGNRPLYRLPVVAHADANPLFIVEGEKAANELERIGVPCTTSAGGAKAAAETDWTPVAGKEVVILPDNDSSGDTYAAKVTAIIRHQAPTAKVRICLLSDDWEEIQKKDDVYDWIQAHSTEPHESLRARLEGLKDRTADFNIAPFVGDSGLKHGANGAIADNLRERKKICDEFTPFPISQLPAVLTTFCREVSQAVGCDESFPAMVALAACSSAIGTTRQLCVKYGWFVPPIVWTLLVGESGTQKSPPFRMAMSPLKERQQRDADLFMKAAAQYQSDLKAHKREMKQWAKNQEGDEPEEPERPVRGRCVVQDATIEALAPILNENPRGVLLARDELSGWLAGFDKYSSKSSSSSEVPKWLEIYNAESITIDRKTGDERFLFVRRPFVSICGGIQPGILSRCLTDEHKDSGLQSRLLMTFPPRQAKEWRDDELSPSAQSRYGDCIRDLFELKPEDTGGEFKPATLTLTSEARSLFKDYVNQTGKEQAALHGHLASQWSKLEEIPARLAIIIHSVRQVTTGVSDSWSVDAETMQAAINLGEWFKGETLRINRVLTLPEAEREAQQLATWIQSQGGKITARDLCKARRDIPSSEEAEEKLIELVDMGFGEWKGIHKSREFFLFAQDLSAIAP